MKTIKTTVNDFDDLINLSNKYDFVIDKDNRVVYLLRMDCKTDDGKHFAYVAYTKSTMGGSEHPQYHSKMRTVFNGVWTVYNSGDFMCVRDREKRALTQEDIDYVCRLEKVICWKDKTTKKQTELGVELEVECCNTEAMRALCKGNKLIQDVGTDGSVYAEVGGSGTEIRFNHPRISDWHTKDVKRILDMAKVAGGKTDGGSAGMHIHISHKDVKKAVEKFRNNLSVMQDILYPINCRPKVKGRGGLVSYGVGGNIYHDQTAGFGTLEIRAWNSTLNTKMFMARLRFAKKLVDFLVSDLPVTVEDFFKSLGVQGKRDYMFMLTSKENPHKWGKYAATKKLLKAA